MNTRLAVYDELRSLHRKVSNLLERVDPDDTVLFHAVETLGDVFYLAEGIAAKEEEL